MKQNLVSILRFDALRFDIHIYLINNSVFSQLKIFRGGLNNYLITNYLGGNNGSCNNNSG